MESGHLNNKYFIKKTKEKRPSMEKFGVFSPRDSYNYTLNRKLTQRWIKSGSFFDFQKIGRGAEASPHPPLVACSMLEGAGGNDLQFFQKHHFSLETGV